jgi:2,4-dichlorophenol 6-monooxygenase
LCGRGEFTVLTGIGGGAWVTAAETVSKVLGMPIRGHVIGPRQTYVDHTGDWARASEISDTGCLLVRPDQHVAWRSADMAAGAEAELRRALITVLSR